MYSNHLHYLPAQLLLYLVLGGLLLGLLLLLEIGILNRAYRAPGPGAARRDAGAARLAGRRLSQHPDRAAARGARRGPRLSSTRSACPISSRRSWTGRARSSLSTSAARVIPVLLSIYLIGRNRISFRASWRRRSWRSSSIGSRRRSPASALRCRSSRRRSSRRSTALVLSRQNAAPLAYVGGSLGVLIGADLSNLVSCRASARRSPRSAAQEPSTACSSPASSRCCCRRWATAGRRRGAGGRLPAGSRRLRLARRASRSRRLVQRVGASAALARPALARPPARASARLRPATIRSRSSRGCAGPSG